MTTFKNGFGGLNMGGFKNTTKQIYKSTVQDSAER